jgi:hypothetical protein
MTRMARDEVIKKEWLELADLLGKMLEQRIGLTEGCRVVVSKYRGLEPSNDLFDRFTGFDSESDAYPLGEIRTLWAEDSLKKIDVERNATENHYREWVLENARELRNYAQRKAGMIS